MASRSVKADPIEWETEKIAYSSHSQRYLAFIIVAATGFVAEVQFALRGLGVPLVLFGPGSGEKALLVVGALGSGVIAAWGVFAAVSEMYFLSALESRRGVLELDDRILGQTRTCARAGVMARRWAVGRFGSPSAFPIELIPMLAIVFILTLIVAAAS